MTTSIAQRINAAPLSTADTTATAITLNTTA